MATHYDAAIIGTGQAGPSLANRLSKAGAKVAVIERGRFGGTCVNTGCMPTKALVASAYAAHLAAHAADYGVVIDGRIGIDMKRVKARKDLVSDTASHNVETWLRSMPNCTIIRGEARFGRQASLPSAPSALPPTRYSSMWAPAPWSRRSPASRGSTTSPTSR
jgi:pyruvate/2-oxoglutarate dehydrogenase complex dihydrolipoamide dehydrogenase (E3) component